MKQGSSFIFGSEAQKWLEALGDQVVVSATNFLTGVIIARAFGKDQFGLYILGYSIIIIILEIHNSFISSPYTINSAHLRAGALAHYTGSVLILVIGLSVLCSICLISAGAVASHGGGPRETAPILCALSVIMGSILLKEYGRRVCFAQLKIRIAFLLDVIVSVTQISGLFLLTLLGFLSITYVYWVMGVASGTAAMIWLIAWRKQLVLQLSGVARTLRETWSFGTWVLGGNLTFLLAQQLYPWYLSWFNGVEPTGDLAACLGILAIINPLISGIGNFLGPKTASASIEGANELWRVVFKTTLFLSAAIGLFCLAIIFLGEHIMILIYGKQYIGSSRILSILAISFFASNFTLAVGFGFWAIGRPDINCKINLIALGITLTLGLWLVKAFGILGVAYGFLFASAAVSAVRLITFIRLIQRV